MEPRPEVYTTLRSRLFSANPSDFNINPSKNAPNVWGVLMEFRITNGIVTLVSLADGTTSVYFNNGGGVIGGGQHEEVATLTKNLVIMAESFYLAMEPAHEFPGPTVNCVRFYVLTFSGIYGIEVMEDKLISRRDKFSPLFYAGNDVITSVRTRTPSTSPTK